MDGLLFSRLQFGATTVYHFFFVFFVPVSIGLALYLALMQTAWYRTGNPKYRRMVKFWSKPFLICFAMGVVTGIVLEFQIGMNWSQYSRFVGDVFGAPLAMEALLAFFLEATFIGLWVFGWDRLPKGVHLACIWCVAIGTNLSAFFIIAANSWMQHPVGYTYNAKRGRAELTDIGAVLTNKVAIAAYPHIVAGAALSAAAVVIGISAWHLARGAHVDVMRTSLRFGFAAALIAGIGTTITGDAQGKVMTEVQPMKMAAAEALWDSTPGASFSVFTIGTRDATHEVFSVRVPYLLSFISHGDIHATVEGINDVQAEYEPIYGPGDYRPHIPTTYWSFRYLIGLGAVTTALSLLGLWLTRRGRLPEHPLFWRALIWTTPLAILANGFGWVFTEMGRQPWVVFGEMFTRDALSPMVPAWQVITSLVVFTAIYAALAVVAVRLLIRYAQAGPPPDEKKPADADDTDRKLAFAY
jgi:cytochrome d ubiquinol oxidase subunit I